MYSVTIQREQFCDYWAKINTVGRNYHPAAASRAIEDLKCLVGPGGNWWDLVRPGGNWWDLVGPGETWWNLVRPGGTWWDIVGPSGTWWNLILIGKYNHFHPIYSFRIPYNMPFTSTGRL